METTTTAVLTTTPLAETTTTLMQMTTTLAETMMMPTETTVTTAVSDPVEMQINALKQPMGTCPQERCQVFRAGGFRSSSCRFFAATQPSLHSSKKARICVNLVGRLVEGWGPYIWTFSPVVAPAFR